MRFLLTVRVDSQLGLGKRHRNLYADLGLRVLFLIWILSREVLRFTTDVANRAPLRGRALKRHVLCRLFLYGSRAIRPRSLYASPVSYGRFQLLLPLGSRQDLCPACNGLIFAQNDATNLGV